MNQPLGDFTVPSWIKSNAGWWADDQIDDSSFVSGLQWLISNDVIMLPTTEQGTVDDENIIPGWIKNTAGWWADDQIHDITFVAAIKYLIGEGIIIIEQETEVEVVEEPVEVEEVKEFHMIVNDGNCCLNWAHVGEEYIFQIETLDEYRGNPIDGVKISVKIISKDGELRYNFGEVITDDGIYRNSVIIPSMDWYAGNILSVTGEYYGVEKTIEKEFEVFKSKGGDMTCSKISCYTIKSVGSVSDSTNLDGIRGVETFTIGDSTYVIAAAQWADRIVIYDISAPTNPTSVGMIRHDDDTSKELNGPVELDIATIGGKPYAVVASYEDWGIEIIDISDPTSPSGVGRATHHNTNYRELGQPYDVAIATIGDSTYAVVTGYGDDGVQIIDISDPTSPSSTGRITDRDDSTRELEGANGVAITTIGSSTYAVITGTTDDGISIIDISTPSSQVYVSELEDGTDTGVCTAANGERCLDGPRDVEIETINGLIYAIVASHLDDAITIIDITNVSNPSIVASMYDSSTKELDQAKGVSIFTIGVSTYVVVGSTTDDGIEIIQIMDRQI